jgi:DNA-binding CsgD family transcriptional regulator
VLGGLVAYLGGDDARALPHLQRALEAARRTGDTGAEGWALELLNEVSSRLQGDREAALARFRKQAAASRARGFTTLEAAALCEMATYTATVEDAELARQTAERAGAWLFACQAQLLQGAVLLFQGQVDEAESLFVRAGPAMRLGNPTSAPKVDVGEALLYLHRGEAEDARRVLYGPGAETEAAGLAFWQADRAAALGWLAWEEGDWEGAAAHLARAAAGAQSGFYQLLVGGPVMLPLHVDALLRLGRGAEAAAAIEQAAAGYSPPARFFAAGLAAARFRLRPTPEGAAQAAAQAGAAPWPWLGALVGCWQGELLGDAPAAQEARQGFERIGAHCGLRRAEDVLRRLGARAPGRAGAPETLSPRELEVAELVAEGLSNPAIARRLYLSRPTVASHVAHILTKLGFTSRAQIGAWIGERRAPVG